MLNAVQAFSSSPLSFFASAGYRWRSASLFKSTWIRVILASRWYFAAAQSCAVGRVLLENTLFLCMQV